MSLLSRRSPDTCRCQPAFVTPGGTGFENRTELRVDADDCPGDGDLAAEPACRATVIDALAERDADAVRVRSAGHERWYVDDATGLLHAAGQFAALAEHHDSEIAATARTDPLGAAHEAVGRAGPVDRLAAETGLAEGAARIDGGYEAALRSHDGPAIARCRIDHRPPADAALRDAVSLPTGGTVFVPGVGDVAGWRLLFVASAVPGLLVFIIRSQLSETPYYLARTGDVEGANDRLRAIAEENGQEVELIDADAVEAVESPGFSRLFEADIRTQTVMIAAAWFCINFGYYGVFIWLPQTVNAAGVAVGNVYLYFLLIAVVQFPGYFSAAYLVERIGRKPTLGGYMLLSGVFTFVFAASMPGVALFGVAFSGFWPFFLGLLASSFFTLGAWGAIYAYTPELFPTEARATGNGFAGGVGKIAAVIGPILAGALVSSGYLLALVPLAVAFAVGGLVVLTLGQETKGRPLF